MHETPASVFRCKGSWEVTNHEEKTMKWKLRWLGGLGWPMWSVTDTDDSTVIFVRDFSSANSFNELFEKDYFVGYSTFITDDFPVDQLWDHEILHIHISDIENPDELFRNDNDDL